MKLKPLYTRSLYKKQMYMYLWQVRKWTWICILNSSIWCDKCPHNIHKLQIMKNYASLYYIWNPLSLSASGWRAQHVRLRPIHVSETLVCEVVAKLRWTWQSRQFHAADSRHFIKFLASTNLPPSDVSIYNYLPGVTYRNQVQHLNVTPRKLW